MSRPAWSDDGGVTPLPRQKAIVLMKFFHRPTTGGAHDVVPGRQATARHPRLRLAVHAQRRSLVATWTSCVPSNTYSRRICTTTSRRERLLLRQQSRSVAFACQSARRPREVSAPSTFVHAAALITTSMSSHGRRQPAGHRK